MSALVPFDHTFVLYDSSDLISLAAAVWSLVPIFILVFYFSWFVCTREIEAVIVAAGHVANDVVNSLVKNTLKQERPELASELAGFRVVGNGFNEFLGTQYGMPSAHSQFMGFFASYFVLKLWLQWSRSEGKAPSQQMKVFGTLCFLLAAYCVCASRVYLFYHTLEQVAMGVSLGAFLGTCYFLLISFARAISLVNWVVNWPFSSWLSVKDSWSEGGLTLEEERLQWLERCKGCKLGTSESEKKGN
ncbi:hypothetical protein LJB42_001027 [Komagataella kurtzmanii]|nr:hypothetical protein LJB42_001027 [Komagataella kurtzmanii]